jgi:hypothetical protein
MMRFIVRKLTLPGCVRNGLKSGCDDGAHLLCNAPEQQGGGCRIKSRMMSRHGGTAFGTCCVNDDAQHETSCCRYHGAVGIVILVSYK